MTTQKVHERSAIVATPLVHNSDDAPRRTIMLTSFAIAEPLSRMRVPQRVIHICEQWPNVRAESCGYPTFIVPSIIGVFRCQLIVTPHSRAFDQLLPVLLIAPILLLFLHGFSRKSPWSGD